MDLANHHLAQSTQAADARHAERVNEYRRIAAERRAEERTTATGSTASLPQRIWHAVVEAATLQHSRAHRLSH
ncbi:hypothetical protein AVP42_02938 [Agromyces sp. NDB4Y10]|uniref:hypothetical protein n=1 Tax=Agromyces sp. NDB4Y10 TaxID=1775951 RepID=UPI0007B26636|nr:hypothetical protein [Agromyces sp. NDB4Y10]KZE91990.1 hypothetical protein AVP42_02938 [Agromyces sp. NDB4Y10]